MTILTTRDVKGVGFSIPRPDGAEKVTGQTRYVADLHPRGMLHAKLLRSPHAHARITRLDVSKARALPGVRAVLTAADIPQIKPGAKTRAHAMLARDRVIFAGQPIAAIAADELAIAEEAADLIVVEYEVLPVAADPEKSVLPGAPRVADLGTEADLSEAAAHSGVAVAAGGQDEKPANVPQQVHFSRGDVAKGFAESDVILEKTYRLPMVHQGYIETHAALADWDAAGRLTLWASTQGIFNTRAETADVLEIPESQIKVIPMECGGGFGAKIRALCEPLAAILAKHTRRPVRLVMSRREELEAGMPAPQVIIKLKTGAKKDGTLTAISVDTTLESGAISGAVLTINAVMTGSFYQFPNLEYTGREVLTHKTSIAAYRAPTAPHTFFAVESHMEQLAKKLGLDPIEFRLRSMSKAGDPMTHGQSWAPHGAAEALKQAVQHPMWKRRGEWKAGSGKNGAGLRGTGIAVGGWIPGIQPCAADVKLGPDGHVNVFTGAIDIAGTNQGLAMLAATTFGVDVDRVHIVTGDSDNSPLVGLSAGSKTTYTVGAAVIAAAEDAKQQTLKIAAAELEANAEDLAITGNAVVVQGVPDKSITLEAIGRKTNSFGSQVAPVHGTGSIAVPAQAPAFAVQIAEVEIDPDTGALALHGFATIQDVGFAINPLGIEGQIQGGAVQSLGIALTEGLMYDDQGRVMNPSLLDYRQLTAADVPDMETELVAVPAPHGPMGARGVGEPPIVPAPAAIANAIEDAVGVRLTETPMTPERIALAMLAKG
ncbi:MAG: xanthine dehydrogenase family protein molybdopterin-binding subunit [Chloroflexota bacterium]